MEKFAVCQSKFIQEEKGLYQSPIGKGHMVFATLIHIANILLC